MFLLLTTRFLLLVSATLPAAAQHDSLVRIDSDGWSLVGTLSRPTRGPNKAPAVLLLNRAAGNREDYDSLARTLARLGVASLRLDLRGHGESVNRGKFVPGSAGMDTLLSGTERDIAAGLWFLARIPELDSARLGLVGASYSGELAIAAARGGAPSRVYAMLSPGSLSAESVAWLDARGRRWLFAASRRERAQATRDVITMVGATSTLADIILLAPEGHATRMFEGAPEFNNILASWLTMQLRSNR